MIGAATGRERDSRCRVCGAAVREREAWLGVTCDPAWWSPVRHDAPCGAPCIGGGVRPKHSSELPPGVGGIDHAHREFGCGSPGCKGGAP